MRKSVFIKHLESLGEAELREELDRLYDSLPEVQQYYKMELGSKKDRQRHYEKARKTISDKFRTKSYRKPRRPRIQKLNLFIKEVERAAVFPHELIEIYLHVVETAIEFMVRYKFISKPVINTVLNYFEKGLQQIRLCRLGDEYRDRCQQIERDSRALAVISPAVKDLLLTFYPES